MPNLDYFLLDRFGLDGPPGGGKYKSVVLNSSGTSAVIVPAQATNAQVQNLANFEAGTKLISVHTTGGTPMQLTVSNGNAAYCRLALFDSAAVPWFLHTLGALLVAYSVCSVTIDITGGGAYTIQIAGYAAVSSSSTLAWTSTFFGKPSNFNINGPLVLAICGSNANGNAANGTYYIENVRVTSL